MPKKVHALLVGIDAYAEPVRPLGGCRNDVRYLEEYLRARLGDALVLRTLVDERATRAAVIDSFRSHLGQASSGDVALFAYSGHGSQGASTRSARHVGGLRAAPDPDAPRRGS
ncbi:MAG: caspase family protein [Ilumatobacteraceae bacterium]